MDFHIPYGKHKNRDCDFIVEYRFFSPEEGGRQTGNPIQGYRSDFLYDADEYTKIFMIWPEFLDNNNDIILDKTLRIPTSGKANMWIINDENRLFHSQRIKIGLKGYFVEGLHKVAECKVIEIVNLNLK